MELQSRLSNLNRSVSSGILKNRGGCRDYPLLYSSAPHSSVCQVLSVAPVIVKTKKCSHKLSKHPIGFKIKPYYFSAS